nr:hypothetical protein [Saprospiraceae bacterium]
MKYFKSLFSNPIFFSIFILFIAVLGLTACGTEQKGEQEESEDVEMEEREVVEVVTNLMDFQMVGELPSGWHTFEYSNNSEEVHFFIFNKYPEGKTIEDGKQQVVPVFQKGMDLINEGKPEEGFEAFGELPEWFYEVEYAGGAGLISPGMKSQTTIKLEPGYYVMECYVKMTNGMFHGTMGMVHELVVTEEETDHIPPVPNANIKISTEEGIVFKTPILEGEKTFSVHFKDQTVHENFVGHDVNLVRLGDRAELEELEKWMNWADPEGLITPSPEDVTFLGGVSDLPEGSTGYFTTVLLPGKYAFVSEVPNSMEKNMLKTFEVVSRTR